MTFLLTTDLCPIVQALNTHTVSPNPGPPVPPMRTVPSPANYLNHAERRGHISIRHALSIASLAATLLAACGLLTSVSGPPAGAVDAVSEATGDIVRALGWREFSGLKVTDSEKMDLTPAQVANGATESWCLAVAYAARSTPTEPWFDLTATWRLEYANGQWEISQSYPEAESCDVVR